MDGINNGLNLVLKYVILVVSIIVLFILLASNANEKYNNAFKVTFNDKVMYATYDSVYVEVFLLRDGGSKVAIEPENKSIFNKIGKSDKYIMDLNEYELYNVFGVRTTFYNNKLKYFKLKEVFDDNKTMMIQKDGKTIYEGEFKRDVTSFITENGRYYFHIYTKQKRNSSIFAFSKTSIHFNVLVGEIGE